MKRLSAATPLLAGFVLLATGCDDITGVADDGGTDAAAPEVAIQFGTAAQTSASVAPAGDAGIGVQQTAGDTDSLVVSGTNGTLTLTDVRLIVAEFELKRASVDCDTAFDEDVCEKFTAPPAFIDLPLAGGAVPAVAQEVPPDTYKELDFEIEDLEVDEDEDDQSQAIQALMDSIRAEFPDWPEKASFLATGTFTPADGGDPVPFRVYFKAEIEIELEFEPPLVIGEQDTDKNVTVQLDPAAWFGMPDGTVLDLSAYDYDTTGELLEFEVEFEDGVKKMEWEDRDEDDD